MAIWLNKKVLVLSVAALALAAFLLAVVLSPKGVQAACSSDQFTVAGVFDLQGYLACEAASSGTVAGGAKAASGTLPTTGSSATQLVGIALAIVIIGIAGVVMSSRERSKNS